MGDHNKWPRVMEGKIQVGKQLLCGRAHEVDEICPEFFKVLDIAAHSGLTLRSCFRQFSLLHISLTGNLKRKYSQLLLRFHFG